jgi:hypothetical protein
MRCFKENFHLEYRTAWAWLHKLRRSMVRSGRDRLSGTIEVDETFIGGKKRENEAVAQLAESLL